jgi:SAM-dependent methyltransferase
MIFCDDYGNMSQRAQKIVQCRACGSTKLNEVLSLGTQYLSGVFPKSKEFDVPKYPLCLVRCSCCTLVQLSISCPLQEMYGEGYGYRSSATSAMRGHLQQIANEAKTYFADASTPSVLDIGCNDGYLLEQFPGWTQIGFDPAGVNIKKSKAAEFEYIVDFFSASSLRKIFNQKVDLVTTISMFYDLEDPVGIANQINEVLSNNGIWILEVSYLGSVVKNLVYDSICHEHLVYYSLEALERIVNLAGFDIYHISLNDLNGGSLRLHMVKQNRTDRTRVPKATQELAAKIKSVENETGIRNGDCFQDFNTRLNAHRHEVQRFFDKYSSKKKIIGYGASTKGNVMLQYCGITNVDLFMIGDVSTHKHGCFTPGTKIEIVAMEQAINERADFYFVLPWSFKKHILKKERANRTFLSRSSFVFPFPKFSIEPF